MIRTSKVFPLSAALLVLVPALRAEAPTADDLRVEHRAAPLGLDTTLPRFSWSILDSDRSAKQSAYRILVASSEALLDLNQGDLWDSGKRTSSRQHLVPYIGSSLLSGKRYWWKVRLWDDENVLGAWSENSSFDLTPSAASWTASYIWDGSAVENDTAYLRKAFPLNQGVSLGKIYVSAHEELALWVNGTLVLRGPAPADPYEGMRLVPLDVTSLLVVGENVLAARVHWGGGDGNAGVRAEPAFVLQADLDLADGSRTTIVSDAGWRVLADTPYDEAAPLRGPVFGKATAVEDFDARLEPLGWLAPGFDDSGWATAQVVQPGFKTRSQEIPSNEVLELIPPVSILRDRTSKVYVIDFGRNVAGWISLRIKTAAPGDRVTAYYSEELQNGRIVRDRDGITDLWDAYTCRGGGLEIWEPDIGYMGFRYVEIEGFPGNLKPSDVRLVRCGTPLERVASFSSSSTALDDVLAICLATQEACTQGILVDCTQREQTQHMADALIQGRNLATNYRETNILAKCLRDIEDGDLGAGVLRSHHPSERISIIPEWTLSWVQAIELAWLHTGDKTLLAELYPLLEEVLDRFYTFVDSQTGLILALPIPSYPYIGLDVTAPGLVTLNSFYCDALRIGMIVATALGESDDASRFGAQASALAAAIRSNLFDGVDRYLDGIGSTSSIQLASALPLLFGIEQEPQASIVAESMRGRGLDAGTVGGYYVTRALVERDFGDELLAVAVDPTQHWGAILQAGGTTTWESWDTTYSLCHAWSAYPMAFVLEGLVGITPTAPGWSKVEIRPRVAEALSFADGSVPTPRGPVQARWDQDDLGRFLRVTLPANMTAVVAVPIRGFAKVAITENDQDVFRDGAFVSGVDGVGLDGIERDYIRFRVDAGTYSFRMTGVRWDPAPAPSGGSIARQ